VHSHESILFWRLSVIFFYFVESTFKGFFLQQKRFLQRGVKKFYWNSPCPGGKGSVLEFLPCFPLTHDGGCFCFVLVRRGDIDRSLCLPSVKSSLESLPCLDSVTSKGWLVSMEKGEKVISVLIFSPPPPPLLSLPSSFYLFSTSYCSFH